MKKLFLLDRFLALIIDSIIVSVISSVLSSIINLEIEIDKINFLNMEWMVSYNVKFIFLIIYFILFDFFSNGITFGKQIMKLRVENISGNIPELKDRILRTILKTFLIFNILLPLTFIYYCLKNEILYDKIMKTNTVK